MENKKTLNDLKGFLIQFSPVRGAYKWLRPNETLDLACGLYFECPAHTCQEPDKKHGMTLLFDQENVASDLRPIGRWLWNGKPLHQTTLQGLVLSATCGWKGVVRRGEVLW